MRREHVGCNNQNQTNEEIILDMPLNGDFVEQNSGVNIETMFGNPSTNRKNYFFVSDPVVSGGLCLKRSTTTNACGLLDLIVDPRGYSTSTPTRFKKFVEIPTSKLTAASGDYSFLASEGLTMEFEFLCPSLTTPYNVHLTAFIDSIYASGRVTFYGFEITRYGSSIYIRERASYSTPSNKIFYPSLKANKWYKIVQTWKVEGSTYSTNIKLYDTSTNSLEMDSDNMTNTLSSIPLSGSTLDRTPYFFNSIWGYHGSGANTIDYLKNVKIKKILT